jgi:hypothetical protein
VTVIMYIEGTTLLTTLLLGHVCRYRINCCNSLYFTVKAKDAAGNLSAASNVASVTTSGTTYCVSKEVQHLNTLTM